MNRFLLASLMAVLVAGCINPGIRMTDDDDAGLIFGYFDMSEASPLAT